MRGVRDDFDFCAECGNNVARFAAEELFVLDCGAQSATLFVFRLEAEFLRTDRIKAVGFEIIGDSRSWPAQFVCFSRAETISLPFAVDQQGFADEISDERRLRIMVEIVRRIDLFNFPLVHDDDPVSKSHGFTLIVRDIEDRCFGSTMDALDFLHHHLLEVRIQGTQRFIHQQHLRLRNDGAGQGNALFLPSR